VGRWRLKRREIAAFQGEPGAFSQQAAWRLLGPGTAVLPCQTFREVFQSLRNGLATAAVIPIENTLHGSVHENYDHLLEFDLKIVAESRLRIVHNLIAPPGVSWKDIRTVYSHPVALNQCLRFFAEHPHLRRESFYDTAGSVQMILRDRPEGAAAIASEMAAEIYGGRILRRSIEDDPENYTRFFLLRLPSHRPQLSFEAAKTSVVFAVRDTPGALFRALGALALRDLSIAKIESRPMKGRPWEYLFYLDFAGNLAEPRVAKALGHLEELAEFVRVLGCYGAAGETDARRASPRESKVRRRSGTKRSV
jgi:prephenate dehydratase